MPFLRRFTNEMERERQETAALYRQAREAYLASVWSHENVQEGVIGMVLEDVERYVEFQHACRVFDALTACLRELLDLETAVFRNPEAIAGRIDGSAREMMEARAILRKQLAFLEHESRTLDLLVRDLGNVFGGIMLSAKTANGSEDEALFTVSLIEVLANPHDQVDKIMGTVSHPESLEAGLFEALHERLYRNLCEASGIIPGTERKKPYLYAKDSPLPPRELAETYLKGTPFLDLMLTPVPLAVPFPVRFEHTHILAGTGHGKTQTLQHLILSDLQSDKRPSLVIIDSQGEMIDKLSRLSIFRERGDPVIIDPREVPALNLFDVRLDRLSGYGDIYRQQILNGVIELYDYIFGSLLGAELTQKQSVIFRYLARLMLAIPGATIHTLVELLSDEAPYRQYIETLPPGARLFFETEFPHKSFADTKKQIQRRLWGILENPTFEKMMTAPRNRVDMFDAINSGMVVLVNTAKDFLKAERSSFLGRFFISLTLQAALERAAIPEDKRRPAFLYIDEAADYFDSNIDDLLTQARKYKLGVVFAHQYLDQLAPGLRSSIASNTSIKFAGGVSDRDARALAPDMRTTPTFIMDRRKHEKATQFACFVRNATPQALSVTVPFGSIEREEMLSESEYWVMREMNKVAVCADEDGETKAGEIPAAIETEEEDTSPQAW